MTPEAILKVVRDTPFTPPERGRQLYDHIRKTQARRCLELGFAHGVSCVWIGGAIQSLGGGKLIAIDQDSAHERVPDAPSLIQEASLEDVVDLVFDSLGYNWHFKRNLPQYVEDQFDFIFLDGGHNWNADALAFLLADRVLKPGGWILLDDLDWTYASSPNIADTPFVQGLSEEERTDPQVRAVWERLVLTHPDYGEFVEDKGWGWARKVGAGSGARELTVKHTTRHTVRLPRALRKLLP